MSGRAALRGALAGLVGVAVMTLRENAGRSVTHRPHSSVPARTLTALRASSRCPLTVVGPVPPVGRATGTPVAVGAR